MNSTLTLFHRIAKIINFRSGSGLNICLGYGKFLKIVTGFTRKGVKIKGKVKVKERHEQAYTKKKKDW